MMSSQTLRSSPDNLTTYFLFMGTSVLSKGSQIACDQRNPNFKT